MPGLQCPRAMCFMCVLSNMCACYDGRACCRYTRADPVSIGRIDFQANRSIYLNLIKQCNIDIRPLLQGLRLSCFVFTCCVCSCSHDTVTHTRLFDGLLPVMQQQLPCGVMWNHVVSFENMWDRVSSIPPKPAVSLFLVLALRALHTALALATAIIATAIVMNVAQPSVGGRQC